MDGVFTTGKIAKLCKVAPRTVAKWIDTGQLKGYRIPNSLDRRVTADELRAFLAKNELPLDFLQKTMINVLVISDNQLVLDNFNKAGSTGHGYCTAVASDAFEAGMQTLRTTICHNRRL